MVVSIFLAVLMVLAVETSSLQLEGGTEGSPNINIIVNVNPPPVRTITMASRRKLAAKGVRKHDAFGRAVAVDNGVMVVGSPYSGNAYIMDTSGNEIKLPVEGNHAVAIGDGVVVVGTELGDVSLFEARGGALIESLRGETFSFGSAVAVDDGVIVVGAWDADAAYVYDATGELKSKLLAEDGVSGGKFGWSVAVDSGVIVIGADTAGTGGSAYVFGYDGHQLSKLVADDPQHFSFGHSVAVHQGVIAIGAPFVRAAYIFDMHGNQKHELSADDMNDETGFGWAVAVNNRMVVVGAPLESLENGSVKMTGCGSAYVFDFVSDTACRQVAKLRADDAKEWANYGESVAVDSGMIVVGAKDEDGVYSNDFWIFS